MSVWLPNEGVIMNEQLALESESPGTETVPAQKTKQSWGEVIQYLDGYAWGIAADGQTICLGREVSIREVIANPKLMSFIPEVDGIISLERELIAKEIEGNGRQPELKKPSTFRSRTARTFERRTANTRQAAAGKRLPLHQVVQPLPGVSGRRSPGMVKKE